MVRTRRRAIEAAMAETDAGRGGEPTRHKDDVHVIEVLILSSAIGRLSTAPAQGVGSQIVCML